MYKIIKKLLASWRIRILVGLLVFYLAFSYWAVNPLAQRILPWLAETQLASQLQVERVRFDPLALSITVDHLRLHTQDGAPLASFEQLYVDLESNGMWRRAWHFRDIRLLAPQITLDIADDGRFNWAGLLSRLNSDNKAADNTMVRLLIDHILIERGNLHYEERNRPTPFKAVLQPLGFELDGLSTLPEDRGEYSLQARFPEQGGTLRWKGELGLNPLVSTGSLEIADIKLEKLMQLVRSEDGPLVVTGGDMGAHLSYQFAMVKDKAEPFPQARVENLELMVEQLTVALQAAGEPQANAALEQLHVDIPTLIFSKQGNTELSINQLELNAREFSLMRQDQKLFGLEQARVAGVDYDLGVNHIQIAEILLADGTVNTRRDQNGHLDWQQLATAVLPVAEIESEVPEASQIPSPLGFSVQQFELERWQLKHQDNGFVHPLTLVARECNLKFAVDNESGAVAISALHSQLGGLDLRSALYRQPVVTVSRIDLQDGAIDMRENTANLAAAVISGLRTAVLVEPDRSLNWQAILQSLPDKNNSAGGAAVAEAAPWRFGVERVALENARVHVEDRTMRTPLALDIENVRLELQQLTQDFSSKIPVKASLQVQQGGALHAGGKLSFAPLNADLEIKLHALALPAFSPYLNQATLLKLDSGKLQLNGKLTLNTEKSLRGQFRGGFSLSQLGISEELTADSFISWKDISSATVQLALSPSSLHLDELHLVEPAGKFIIHEDGSMNIKRILRAPAAGAAPAPSEEPVASDADRFPVAIERISIDNADLEFADLTLRPQFGTHINALTGVINGLSSDTATTAQVELDGKVDEFGSARIRGTIQPFQATDFTDLTLAFHNLEMNRLTPYSGKFAGRRIDSGKLSVNLEYKIKQRQLMGENKFIINKLQLGERVESPDAVSLPLDLAIALLSDSNGLIDLDLPISGSLDDPQFSYGKIIWKAVVNVLTKIVTSPFRALGKLLGIDAEKMQDVGFDPGRAELAPQEQEKLKALANGMSERPGLALTLIPGFDPAADKLALQEQATRRDVLQEMGTRLRADEQPGPVDLSNTRTQSAIARLLKERTGAGSSSKTVDAVKDYFRKSKPEDLPIYSAMLDQLRATVTISDEALQKLANARVEAIHHYLVDTAGLEAGRVRAGAVSRVKSVNQLVPLRMELAVDASPAAEH